MDKYTSSSLIMSALNSKKLNEEDAYDFWVAKVKMEIVSELSLKELLLWMNKLLLKTLSSYKLEKSLEKANLEIYKEFQKASGGGSGVHNIEIILRSSKAKITEATVAKAFIEPVGEYLKSKIKHPTTSTAGEIARFNITQV